ncbi:MAG TPA: hypothetical protein VKE94_02910, partial [Gemmataceae bacterium]|nr:hypothetical protein [Gemmataceae bacterium]
MLRLPADDLRHKLAEAKRKLFEVRRRRIPPGRDEKVLTAWNGLMIDAFARAAQVLDDPRYAATAGRAAEFLLSTMRTGDGKLMRTWSAGSQPKLNAYLEDYSFMVDALVSLYEATFEPRWIESALDLARVMIDQFWDESEGGFYFTGRDHEALIARTKDLLDNATPSGNAMAATALLRLAKLTGNRDLEEKAAKTLRLARGLMAERSIGCGQMLLALDFHLGPVQEFAVVGDPAGEEARRVLRSVRGQFRPNKVVAMKSHHDDAAERVVPLLAGKKATGGVTTYICEDFVCRKPLLGATAVEVALR